MKRLERIVLVQFYLFEAEEIDVRGNTAWLGPNGAGKTSTLDAVQIAFPRLARRDRWQHAVRM